MTRPINLYLLSRIRQEAAFNHVFRHASKKRSGSKTPIHEIDSLRRLADRLLAAGITVPELDGFFMSYSIPQIGRNLICSNSDLRAVSISSSNLSRCPWNRSGPSF